MYSVWYQSVLHRFSFPVVSTEMALLFSVRTWGYHQVPASGGLLIIANHQSFLDPVLVGMAVRRRVVYLARKTLFRNPFFRWLIKSYGAIPIDQEKPTTEGIRTAVELLRRGEGVVIFPEGERTPHGQMLELKPGVTLLVRRGQVPLLPVGIAGAFEVWPRHQLLPRLCPLWSRQPCSLRSRNSLTSADTPRASASTESHSVQMREAKPLRRGIAVVVGPPIPFESLRELGHEELLQRLTAVLREVWHQAESRRLPCPH
ncbi:MAG: lysophospholipid acyltransferase family protein [Gemmatales bacterium]|nr:1-acyl-sn-glycerol-3-phosphate acyltransferase [Gemmatales bacterium]MDW8174139.1 lysophospholipid acyltransferase family protein [Gemmatales bacterium]MDW8224300.1 lysophospholipid acyltransferase family protein [Gemmatales bacterium]